MRCEKIVWGSTKPVREDCLGEAPFLCEVIVCEGALWGARQFLGGVARDVRAECVGEHL